MFLGHVNDQIPNFCVFYHLGFEEFVLYTENVFNIVIIIPMIFSLGTSYERTIFFFFWTGLYDPILCSLLGGGIPPQNSGYKSTRFCRYLSLGFCYYVFPL